MSDAPRLTATQARRLHLAAQGLAAPPRRRARKADLLGVIERMRLLQIDTIQVVARSPFLVLFSRLGPYRQEWLEELLAERALFECWAHEACFAPLDDYPLHRAHALGGRAHWAMAHARERHGAERKPMQRLLEHIERHGAVKAADFTRGTSRGGWWGWKTEKRWLEAWFALGELMIARRERFQRVYDLRRRVLEGTPWGSLDDDDLPSSAALRRAFALGGVRALGVAQARWIADYFRCKPSFTDAELATWVETGDLVQVAVAGWERAAYVHREHRELLARAVAGRLRATHTALLSPFDPVVWDRARALEMFGFDYRIECYTPAAKRRYGYFALPILHGDRLIGRLDAKAHRAAGVFEVIAVHFESGVEVDERMAAALATTIQTTALWHGTPKVRLGSVVPARARASLRSCLAGAMER